LRRLCPALAFLGCASGNFGIVNALALAGRPSSGALPFRTAVKFLEITPDDWDRIQNVNLKGILFLSQAVIPHMRKRKAGSIACMSSVSAQRGGGIFGGPHYSAAKAGVLGLAKAMAREFGPDGIRVNCVTPGLIGTDITAGKLTDEMKAQILEGIPLGRLGEANDVAGIYTFLASDLSAYVTGAVIDVNGGMLIH
jgi:NAD(P)-dependent dehydrogenase (short-subunit alcohol dehydrogenase family)